VVILEKLKVAIVGYGNVGKRAAEAVMAAPDMELTGIVRRKPDKTDVPDVPVVSDIAQLGKTDAAILCVPTRHVRETALKYLKLGINTVDSFDVHTEIFDLKVTLDVICREHGAVSIVSAGWDPGLDSVIRALFMAGAPKGITYTNFGPGMSMGHSVAARSVPGVKDALSLTIPKGYGLHRREVYVQTEDGADFDLISSRIKSDSYFSHDETHITKVASVDELMDTGHGVHIERKGVSGITDNQLLEFNMRINNPALTAQIMVSCARASFKQKPGAYTMLEIPPVHYLEGRVEKYIKTLL